MVSYADVNFKCLILFTRLTYGLNITQLTNLIFNLIMILILDWSTFIWSAAWLNGSNWAYANIFLFTKLETFVFLVKKCGDSPERCSMFYKIGNGKVYILHHIMRKKVLKFPKTNQKRLVLLPKISAFWVRESVVTGEYSCIVRD